MPALSPGLYSTPRNGLYAITPDCTDTAVFLSAVEAVLAGGCRWLQYRDKLSTGRERENRAKALAELCQRFQALLIINDDLSLAQRVQAAGVHLGREDGSIEKARVQLGPEAIIGASCYQDLALAQRAVNAGASYVAFGAVFPSPTKPEAAQAPLSLFREAGKVPDMLSCAIGGITLQNAPALIAAGASLLAVITDLFQNMADSEAIQRQALAYQQLFEHS